MRIMMTGGAGYIGSHAVRLFLDRGHDVWVYDNLTAGHRSSVHPSRLIEGHLHDGDRLQRSLTAHQIEAVVHFAAFAHVGESVRNPAKYYQNNVASSLTLMESLRRCEVKRVVFSSTAATYGLPETTPITEESRLSPINPYGKTKLTIETALEDYAAAYGWGVACLRYFNAAGASMDGSIGEDHDPETHLIPLVLQVALGQRSHIEIFGSDYDTPDGTCVRDYVHVEDLADAHHLALNALREGRTLRYNLGSETGYSVREVIRAVEEVTGQKIPVREGARRPGDPPVLVASSAKIRRELGWQPRYSDLQSIITSAWNWHRKNPKGYTKAA